MELRVAPVALELRERLGTSWGAMEARELLQVELVGGDGLAGIGEAAPLEAYDGVPLAAVRAALDAYARVLEDVEDPEAALDACRAERDLPQA
ncbi:MAG: hypothetical protein M3P50_08170, partial [Actinomycetota bacterium]|nr:hypothetical protein [Actinomycetota bacterium]